MDTIELSPTDKNRYYKYAFLLALLTIFYNLIEGFVSTYFGFTDESLALFGFGIDSFIEVISGLGIAHMVLRIKMNHENNRDDFEKIALKITGTAFYLLVVGLISSGILNIWTGQKPETTFWGIVISIISIITMWLLIYGKTRVGRKLNSEAILADAECTRVCFYMSIILLISSGIYELTTVTYIDSIGALALSYFAFNEGKECFEKAKSDKTCSCKHD